MKVIVTGSLGHIGKPLTELLVSKGHAVTVISSNIYRKQEIEALGAKSAIGSIEDADFLASAFAGADLAYCMIPPADFKEPDRILHYRKIAGRYAEAIKIAGIGRVIHLSSFGADLAQGTGIIVGAHDAEQILNAVPGIRITHIRPTYFYYNTLNFLGMIRHGGLIAANYGADQFPLIAPADIADAIAEEVDKPGTANINIRYVYSDERTGQEVASVLGAAIGKPDLKWVLIGDAQSKEGLLTHAVPPILAAGLTEMYVSMRNGDLARDFYANKPATAGKIKLEDYAVEFAAAYNASL